jgi:hypothetical protein
MSAAPQNRIDPTDDTGVADVRRVREKIASRYKGDFHKHVAETDRLVEPLIEKLGLRQGVPRRREDRTSETGA